MCEALVYADNKRSADPYLEAALPKRGDVVAVMPDGHQWGREETKPPFRTYSFPGVSESQMSVFLAPELATEPDQRVLQYRAFALDLDLVRHGTSWDDLMAARVRKTPIPDPNVMG